MKKSILFIGLAIAVLSGCKKDNATADISNISSTYKSLMVEYTATWCGPCGAYAFDPLEDTYHTNPYNVCGISIHPSDGVSKGGEAGVADLKTFYSFSGTPQVGINADKQFGFTTDKAYNKNKIQGKLDGGKTKKALAGIGINKTVSGGTLSIKTKTVFFDAASGSYNLAVYVTEDGLVANQTNHTPAQVTHNNVFRGSANGAFGQNITSGASANQMIEGTYSFTLTSDVKNPNNLHVVAVLWKMGADGKPTEMINCNRE